MNSIIYLIMRSPSIISELLYLFGLILDSFVEQEQQRNKRDNMMINRWIIPFAFLVRLTSAQEAAVDICACQPSMYEITLDFELGCDDTDVQGPGINETACLISSRLPDAVNVTDLVPVQVNEIQILELDQNQGVGGQYLYADGPYFNGDKFYYTSVLRINPDLVNSVSLPRGIQVSINGNNALNQSLLNSWGMLYDNDCGVFPLLEIGEKIGWSVFTDLGDPPLRFCPTVPSAMFPTSPPVNETTARTVAVTSSSTHAPTIPEETPSPTMSPPTPAPPMILPPTPTPPVYPLVGLHKQGKNEPSSKAGMGSGISKPMAKSKKDDGYYGKMFKMSSSKNWSSKSRNWEV